LAVRGLRAWRLVGDEAEGSVRIRESRMHPMQVVPPATCAVLVIVEVREKDWCGATPAAGRSAHRN